MDDFYARQFSRQRLALASPLGRRDNLFLGFSSRHFRRYLGQAFGLVEHRQLRRIGIGGLLGFAAKETLDQEGVLFTQALNFPVRL